MSGTYYVRKSIFFPSFVRQRASESVSWKNRLSKLWKMLPILWRLYCLFHFMDVLMHALLLFFCFFNFSGNTLSRVWLMAHRSLPVTTMQCTWLTADRPTNDARKRSRRECEQKKNTLISFGARARRHPHYEKNRNDSADKRWKRFFLGINWWANVWVAVENRASQTEEKRKNLRHSMVDVRRNRTPTPRAHTEHINMENLDVRWCFFFSVGFLFLYRQCWLIHSNAPFGINYNLSRLIHSRSLRST